MSGGNIWSGPRAWGVAVEVIATGGGCEAFRAEVRGGYALITACDDAALPQASDKWVDLGFYRDGGEWVCLFSRVPVDCLCALVVGFQLGDGFDIG